LTRFYPKLKDMELADYKVRVLAGEHGTGAKVRVLIQSRDQESEWGTVGVSYDILEASWQALVDSITYKLMKDEQKQK
jgi:2-isopropylmalate synthase